MLGKIAFLKETLRSLENRYVLKEPINIILQREQEIDDLSEKLFSGGNLVIKFKNESLKIAVGRLEALSPLGILKRGYSITMRENNREIIKDAGILKKKELIRTKLARGEIISKVEDVNTEA